jgi:hypothetical protein
LRRYDKRFFERIFFEVFNFLRRLPEKEIGTDRGPKDRDDDGKIGWIGAYLRQDQAARVAGGGEEPVRPCRSFGPMD